MISSMLGNTLNKSNKVEVSQITPTVVINFKSPPKLNKYWLKSFAHILN